MQRQKKFSWTAALALAGLATATTFATAARAETQPRLYLNQTYAEDATRASTLDVEDPMAVFKFVFGNLPDRVKVYPTENYFYFQFFHRHIRYAGNIRLDVTDRDEGKVHFAYFEDLSEWTYYDESITHRILDDDLRRERGEGRSARSIASRTAASRWCSSSTICPT